MGSRPRSSSSRRQDIAKHLTAARFQHRPILGAQNVAVARSIIVNYRIFIKMEEVLATISSLKADNMKRKVRLNSVTPSWRITGAYKLIQNTNKRLHPLPSLTSKQSPRSDANLMPRSPTGTRLRVARYAAQMPRGDLQSLQLLER